MKAREYRIIGYLFIMASFYFLGVAAYHISVLVGDGWSDEALAGAILGLFASLSSFRIALTMLRQARKK